MRKLLLSPYSFAVVFGFGLISIGVVDAQSNCQEGCDEDVTCVRFFSETDVVYYEHVNTCILVLNTDDPDGSSGSGSVPNQIREAENGNGICPPIQGMGNGIGKASCTGSGETAPVTCLQQCDDGACLSGQSGPYPNPECREVGMAMKLR